MPTYQYACTNEGCGNRFELVQSFADPAVRVCPVCDAPVRKVFSAVGVVFKGSGFYRTDSRTDRRAAAGKSSGAAEKSSASSESASSSSTSSSGDKSTSSSAPKAAAASA